MKRTRKLTRKPLYIAELERPAEAWFFDFWPGKVTTLAIGEESALGPDISNDRHA